MTITKRLVKGSALTHAEFDQNFDDLMSRGLISARERFGLVPSTSTNQTTAFQAALDALATEYAALNTNGYYGRLYLKLEPGWYIVNELVKPVGVEIVCPEDNYGASLVYGGTGGAGSYVMRVAYGVNDSYATLKGLNIVGHNNASSSNKMCQYGLMIGDGTANSVIDYGSDISVRLVNIGGDGIIVNLQTPSCRFGVLRFDGVYGFGVRFKYDGTPNSSGHSVQLGRVYYDNNVFPANSATAMTNDWGYNGTHAGQGISLVESNTFYNHEFDVYGQRIELNKKLRDYNGTGRKALFHVTGTNGIHLIAKGFVATLRSDQLIYFLGEHGTRNSRVAAQLHGLAYCAGLTTDFANPLNRLNNAGGWQGVTEFGNRTTGRSGVSLDGWSIDPVDSSDNTVPALTNWQQSYVKAGDWFPVRAPNDAAAWVAIWPATTFVNGVGSTNNIDTAVTATASSAVLSVTPSAIPRLLPGLAVYVDGIGGGGSTVATEIVSVDSDAATVTIATTATTGGSGKIIRSQDKNLLKAAALYCTGSTTWDPPDLANGAQQSTTVSVSGCRVGDGVTVSMSADLLGTQIWGEILADGTATVYQRNTTGAAQNVASGTIRVWAWRRF